MSAREAVERALEAVTRREPVVKAWASLDDDRARARADAVDARPPGPLTGVILGVKDVFDTADQPTACGSPLYAGRRPSSDAAAVTLLRHAGAVCLGKTVTAEFACYHPGPTTNPHRATHTPGGSSMGSAAAVASGMVDIALGTQTAASIVRPASFCGVYGFKPTYGSVSVSGVKLVAPSLDTVGWFARTPTHMEQVWSCLTGRMPVPPTGRAPRVALMRTEQWEHCSVDSQRAIDEMAASLRQRGATVERVELPVSMVGLADEHRVVMAYEAARALAFEHLEHRSELSEDLSTLLDEGRAIDPMAYDAVRRRIDAAARGAGDVFTAYDAILTPVVVGEAPPGLASTGDPRFGRLWTMLGLPTVAVPTTVGATGLPVGVQLVGAPWADGALLAMTSWLAAPDR